MDFAAALSLLRSGKAVRRAGWKNIKLVRLVDPEIESGVDGPDIVWVVLRGNHMAPKLREYPTEEAARLALREAREGLADAWEEFRAYEVEFAATDKNNAEPPRPPVAPALREDVYQGCSITSRPSRRVTRITSPFLVSTLDTGEVITWTPSVPDILAIDWQAT